MSDLVFLMGAYEAHFPTDRAYCTNHMWAQPRGHVHRFGFTAYAVRLLQDVYFLEWCVDQESPLRQRQTIGSIESKKAESELYAPADGQLVRFNEALLNDPSAINVDKYGSGWLFELRVSGDRLLSPEKYLQHLDSVWEITQRTIKGRYGKTDGGGPFPGPEQQSGEATPRGNHRGRTDDGQRFRRDGDSASV